MGDPKRLRAKFETPAHLWQGTRIADEAKLKSDYGLKNNHEIWRAATEIQKFQNRAKALVGRTDATNEARKEELLKKLVRLGILKSGATLDDVLALEVRDLLDRRVQSIVYRKGIATTMNGARQMILHRHITLGNIIHSSPGTLVLESEEGDIGYVGPVRVIPKSKKRSARDDTEDDRKEKKEESKPEEKKENEPKDEKKEDKS